MDRKQIITKVKLKTEELRAKVMSASSYEADRAEEAHFRHTGKHYTNDRWWQRVDQIESGNTYNKEIRQWTTAMLWLYRWLYRND